MKRSPQDSNNIYSLELAKLRKENKLLKNQKSNYCEMAAKVILSALDYRDHYTFNHSIRVAYYSSLIGRELGLDAPTLHQLKLSALFHDIGKIGIADEILLKPTYLNEEENKIMQQHPEISYNILKEFDAFEEIAVNARYHHENFDGSGYPHQLAGEDIPFLARIILVADTFDAMTSSRPYRKGLDSITAFNEMIKYAGQQFDRQLVEAFFSGMNNEHHQETKQYNFELLKEELKKVA